MKHKLFTHYKNKNIKSRKGTKKLKLNVNIIVDCTVIFLSARQEFVSLQSFLAGPAGVEEPHRHHHHHGDRLQAGHHQAAPAPAQPCVEVTQVRKDNIAVMSR